tara:strand:- start:1974 stop:2570 length:597 start_codon:yes stop_codon:yes gene_type:complete
MSKIKEILIGTNNAGKYKEIKDLLPKEIRKYSPKDFKIDTPEETGKSFEENSKIKALYFSKKTNLLCLSDDSGLEIDILNGEPGIYSSRWGGSNGNFNLAIEKVYKKMKEFKADWKKNNLARFICCLTLSWPDGKIYSSTGIVKGEISNIKKGKKGFGYDPIFIPEGYDQTFGEMEPSLKLSIDHRFKAYMKLKTFFD